MITEKRSRRFSKNSINSRKKLEILKAQYQQSLLYRGIQQPDPEIEHINRQMDHLKDRREGYFKILQAATSIPPSIPEIDWYSSPFYSHTLRSWNFDDPPANLVYTWPL